MNLAALIDGHPDDAPALLSRGDVTSYGLLRGQVASLRGGLLSLGLERGDRLAVMCANNWYFVTAYLAGMGAGLTVVPLNPMSPGPEVADQLAHVGARAIVVGPAGRSSFGSIDRASVPSLDFVIDCGSGADGSSVSLDDLMQSAPVPMVECDAEEIAVLMFTSGTAGHPKAAMLSHRALINGLRSLAAAPGGGGLVADDVVFAPLPLFHIYGLAVTLGAVLAAGALVVLVERFDPSTAIETIRDRQVTVVAGPPALWSALAALPGVEPADMAKVRIAITGAAPLNALTIYAVKTYLGVELSQGYGLTESSSIATTTRGIDGVPLESIGRPLPGVAIRLVDRDGEDVLIGDEGEVLISSGSLFSGYWNDEASTEESLDAEGWLHTGDIGVVDDNGTLFLVDRIKDLVIVSGFNVFPAEVENAIRDHPSVADVAVIGVPHPHSGESVSAYVAINDGEAVEEDVIIEYCGARLARYKCPNKVVFVEEIPRGVNGKVLRRNLRT